MGPIMLSQWHVLPLASVLVFFAHVVTHKKHKSRIIRTEEVICGPKLAFGGFLKCSQTQQEKGLILVTGVLH